MGGAFASKDAGMAFCTFPNVTAPYLGLKHGSFTKLLEITGSSHTLKCRLYLTSQLDYMTCNVTHLCSLKRSDVYSRYSLTFRPVMSTMMSPVTTFIWGGWPPTPLGQEKPVPCIEHVQRTGSWMRRGREGVVVMASTGREKKIFF